MKTLGGISVLASDFSSSSRFDFFIVSKPPSFVIFALDVFTQGEGHVAYGEIQKEMLVVANEIKRK